MGRNSPTIFHEAGCEPTWGSRKTQKSSTFSSWNISINKAGTHCYQLFPWDPGSGLRLISATCLLVSKSVNLSAALCPQLDRQGIQKDLTAVPSKPQVSWDFLAGVIKEALLKYRTSLTALVTRNGPATMDGTWVQILTLPPEAVQDFGQISWPCMWQSPSV